MAGSITRECQGCGNGFNSGFGHEMLCPDCNRHIAIGRAVEGMNAKSALSRGYDFWFFEEDMTNDGTALVHGKTPLEALTKGKKK